VDVRLERGDDKRLLLGPFTLGEDKRLLSNYSVDRVAIEIDGFTCVAFTQHSDQIQIRLYYMILIHI
jgi:hypothetical protein